MSDAVHPLEAAFDHSLSEGRTRRLPLSAVLDLLPLTHAHDRVLAYRGQMQAGARFPPVAVVPLGGRWVIADGHKRFTAYSALGPEAIVVEVWGVGRLLRDQWRQVRANAGKNRVILAACLNDRREARRLALATLGHWRRVLSSLRHLARIGRWPPAWPR